MTNDLIKLISEMKQTAEREPFCMSVCNPVCDPKMSRSITLDGEKIELLFTLDQSPMLPEFWHLSVIGKIAEPALEELVKTFYPTGMVCEIPREEILKAGLTDKEMGFQRQFYQIKT